MFELYFQMAGHNNLFRAELFADKWEAILAGEFLLDGLKGCLDYEIRFISVN
jgi:hypothetical protein